MRAPRFTCDETTTPTMVAQQHKQSENKLFIMLLKLFNRLSPVFNVFMANLPQVLDQNHIMGTFMIQPFLSILQNCPCPPHYKLYEESIIPTFSLWHLEAYCRKSWLMAVLVILYKYEYKSAHWCDMLQCLMKIVIHTLDGQYHKCKHVSSTTVVENISLRRKDLQESVESYDTSCAIGALIENMSVNASDTAQRETTQPLSSFTKENPNACTISQYDSSERSSNEHKKKEPSNYETSHVLRTSDSCITEVT
ncbi:protein unc-79 homolog [Copidosoma floridanum]|uniref:protein unc-79 homolog n=1 Tax=Copidosoma floridanum TaxID=29053 RepID=UPI000C6FC902|nr:protein unc-79 homolog [Copidosoma floridanum]